MLTGESRFHISTPPGFEPGSLVAGSKRVVHWTSETWWEWSGMQALHRAPPPPQQVTPSVMKPEGGPAASVKPGQKSCVMKPVIGSRRGHQCCETTLTGESRFHISTPLGFEPGSLVTGSKQVVHWTSETWWEWSEIAGSPHMQRKNFTTIRALKDLFWISSNSVGTEELFSIFPDVLIEMFKVF